MISKQNFETVRPFLEFQVKDRGSLVGLGRLELPTSPLSGCALTKLSYRPTYVERAYY